MWYIEQEKAVMSKLMEEFTMNLMWGVPIKRKIKNIRNSSTNDKYKTSWKW
jgi:hypothetical protein